MASGACGQIQVKFVLVRERVYRRGWSLFEFAGNK
jgi:hypothetical protein